jgi:uncharacterized protein with PIN domain
MNDNPLCPECGEEMEFSYSYYKEKEPYYEVDVYVCPKCGKILAVKL